MAYFFAMFKYGVFKKILVPPNDELAYVDNPVESGLSGHWLPLSILKRIMEMRVESRPEYAPKKLHFIITEKYIKPSAYTTVRNKLSTYKVISSSKTAAITTNNNEAATTSESNKKWSGEELKDTSETKINTTTSETITNAKLTSSVIVETTPSMQEEVEDSTITKTTQKLSSELTDVATTEISTTLDKTVPETTVGLTKETTEGVTNESTTEVSKEPTTESTTLLTTLKMTSHPGTTVDETGNPFY
ncbi:hypothetical protein KGM_202344 [Danaus plexippus plexippus]|uniref:Uncharacterized protein n=1 Tax=Danaus plexippus plexippus TaxID=278856 RepID=A0A212F2W2_DANPL|nr:hypothetical protein KGM_202344 [Danaus plexippus plexippus]